MELAIENAAAGEGKGLSPTKERRSICGGCDRPHTVCLCHMIPNPPILTRTRIIIIQHPHESRHKLNTTSLLTKSLLNSTSLVARRLTAINAPPDLVQAPCPPPTYYLFPPFPSSPAVTLSSLAPTIGRFCSRSGDRLVLIVFDGTWKHAKEMVDASQGYLGGFATRVCLDGFDRAAEGGSIYDSELVLRKEPCGGCVSTAEAVARWLGVVEENGPQIEERVVGVLREMVRLQTQFMKPVEPRPKVEKKNKINKTKSG